MTRNHDEPTYEQEDFIEKQFIDMVEKVAGERDEQVEKEFNDWQCNQCRQVGMSRKAAGARNRVGCKAR